MDVEREREQGTTMPPTTPHFSFPLVASSISDPVRCAQPLARGPRRAKCSLWSHHIWPTRLPRVRKFSSGGAVANAPHTQSDPAMPPPSRRVGLWPGLTRLPPRRWVTTFPHLTGPGEVPFPLCWGRARCPPRGWMVLTPPPGAGSKPPSSLWLHWELPVQAAREQC